MEIGAHVAQQWCARNAGAARKVFLKVDFRNAFNLVDRGRFLRAFRKHFPGLSPWAEFCYAAPSHLFFGGDAALTSEAGGQQGDPLAPLAFAAALDEILPGVAAAGANGTGVCGPRRTLGILAEWLRRQTRNLVGSALVGSNPADVAQFFSFFLSSRSTPATTPKRFRHHGRVVKAPDSKSGGLCPRRFESG